MAERCQAVWQTAPELALGVADAQERAQALAHLEHCPSCRDHVRSLSDTAEALAMLTPAAEPPPGFETAVVARLTTARTAAAKRRPSRRRLVAAVGGAVAAASLALGLVLSSGAARPAGNAGTPLVAAHRVIGRLVVSSRPKPWMSMALDGPLGQGRVTCQLLLAAGGVETVGSFTITHGHGYWAAPIHAPLTEVVGARLVRADGQVVATATLSAAHTGWR